jgi:ubiquinone/menaquinone biosynthesis C-methylase UbiE
MEFYSELSDFYDIVFPTDSGTVEFLSNSLKPDSKILDLACGTGDYSIALAKTGYNVRGIDLSGEMIIKAKDKAKGLNVDFVEYDMTKANNVFKNEKFDLIFCIGNSIVHLSTKIEIEKFISNIYKMLTYNGIMIIQIINFDRIFKYGIRSLPTIEKPDKGITFIRRYDYENRNVIDFNTEIIYSDGNKEKKFYNSVVLIPLLHRELDNMIKSAGFKKAEFYGGFNCDEYNEDAYALVVKAYK